MIKNNSYHGFVVSLNSTTLYEINYVQSKASVVCSVTAAIFIDFCLKKLNVFFPTYWLKNKWISEFYRTNPKELKCWSTFCVDYFLRYFLIMQHQTIVKTVNETHEWAHRPYQLPWAPSHGCLYKHRRQDTKAATPEKLTGAHLYLDIAKSGYLFHAVGHVMKVSK